MTTLDYWWRAQRKHKPKLMEVSVGEACPVGGFALMLANGRRIERSWRFSSVSFSGRIFSQAYRADALTALNRRTLLEGCRSYANSLVSCPRMIMPPSSDAASALMVRPVGQ
jgi:hypothetical protein